MLDFAQQVEFALSVTDLIQRLGKINISLPAPLSPFSAADVSTFQNKVETQESLHQQRLELDSIALALKLEVIEWSLPYDHSQINEHREVVSRYQGYDTKLAELRATAAGWSWFWNAIL